MTTDTSQQTVAGLLEIGERGVGHLRDPKANYRVRAGDPLVPTRLVSDAGLEEGLVIEGTIGDGPGADRRAGRGLQLAAILRINGVESSVWKPATPFGELVSIDPIEPLKLASGPGDVAMRVVELVSPIGQGQRGLIVAPPKSGKTTLIEQLATGISANQPEVDLIVVLIDERPEEVTHIKRSIRAPVIRAARASAAETAEGWLDTWFHPEAQRRLAAAVARLSSPR